MWSFMKKLLLLHALMFATLTQAQAMKRKKTKVGSGSYASVASQPAASLNPQAITNKEDLIQKVQAALSAMDLREPAAAEVLSPHAQLHKAVSIADISAVDALLKLPSLDLNFTDERGLTALHRAVIIKSLPIIELLCNDFRTQVNACTSKKNTALHIAAKHGHIEAIMVLLGAGALPRIKNIDKKTAADLTESAEINGLLLENVFERRLFALIADMEDQSTIIKIKKWGTPQQVLAIVENNSATLFSGAEAETEDSDVCLVYGASQINHVFAGGTLLHLAAMLGRHEIIITLLTAGADRTIQNQEGFTAADVALNEETTALIEFFSLAPVASATTTVTPPKSYCVIS